MSSSQFLIPPSPIPKTPSPTPAPHSNRVTPTDLMTAATELLSGSPEPRRSSGASGVTRNPFDTPASRPAERRATATAKDIFATTAIRDSSRTHLAFSTSRSRSSQDGHSPPLGSAFATVRPAPLSTPPTAEEVQLSEEASAAGDAFELGHTRFGQRDYAGALDAWRAAVELMPSNRTYQANLRRLERLLEPEQPE